MYTLAAGCKIDWREAKISLEALRRLLDDPGERGWGLNQSSSSSSRDGSLF